MKCRRSKGVERWCRRRDSMNRHRCRSSTRPPGVRGAQGATASSSRTSSIPFVGKLIQQLNGATGDPIAALCDPDFLAQTEDFFASEYQDLSCERHAVGFTEGDRPRARPSLRELQLGAALSPAGRRRRASVAEPTLRRGAEVVPLRLRSDVDRPGDARAGALLEVPRLPSGGKASGRRSTDRRAEQHRDRPRRRSVAAREPGREHHHTLLAVRRRANTAGLLPVLRRDDVPRQPDRVGRQPLQPDDDRDRERGDALLRARGQPPRPEAGAGAGARDVKQPKSYNELRAAGLDQLGDALVELEGQFPFNIVAPTGGGDDSSPLFGIGRTLYFCVPPNTKLLGYWDTVEDRLTKIRNCENIHGQIQLMPLFDPPLDPGMLVKAAAAGLDLAQVVSGLNQPTSPLAHGWLIQKALELANEVRALGASLLAALEKQDAEHLASMRQTHEVSLATFMQNVRFLQWNEAKAATEGLLRTRATALERYTYYLRLLDSAPDPTTAPPTLTVDHETRSHRSTVRSPRTPSTTPTRSSSGKYDLPVATIAYSKLPLAAGSSPSTQSGAAGAGSST